MQLSKLKTILTDAIWTTGGTTETEQATYCTLWDHTSTILESLSNGMIRIVDDHAYVKSIVWLI